MLKYKGCTTFRQRIVMATLSGKTVRIDDIRSTEESPGLTDYEANFLRLMDKVTNGSAIDINMTGTSIKFRPGIISGGGPLVHDCGKARGIGYFLEPLMCLALFAKKPLEITLKGITNSDSDMSIDLFRTVTVKLFKHFGVEEEPELKILKRGAPPDGGGEVHFKCPIVRQLKAVQLLDVGMINRVRGIAYSTRVSPQMSNRMVESSRTLLNHYIPDVYVFTDHFKGAESGLSPGFAISLVAESTTGVLISAEATAQGGSVPEDLGDLVSRRLLQEISKGGMVDTANQWLIILFMALCPEDISKVRIGKLSQYGIAMLRHIRDFFGLTFKIQPEHETKTVLLSCRGIGFTNIAKNVT